jgi:hypothetical protein
VQFRALLALAVVAAGATSCTGAAGHLPGAGAGGPLTARTHPPALAASVVRGAADILAVGVARALFASAPVVVVASADRPAGLTDAVRQAEQAHAPLLLTTRAARSSARSSARPGAGALPGAAVREISALHPRAVLAVGVARDVLAAQLPGLRVVTDAARLPATSTPAPLRRVVVLTRRGGPGPGGLAAAATARAAGAQVIAMSGADPRASPAAIAALAAARPRQVVAVGASFGPARRLAARVAVAVTGVQLPGGGQIVFPLRRLVALYGHPGAPVLGALGQQGLSASIARIRKAAAPYQALSGVPVVPAFEIIATVAQGSPGKDGTYSRASTVASLLPWVQQATRAGLYVILDLQPGRASLLAQARIYQPLLERPDVGLALDAEWKLQPKQVPRHQIGSVRINEVNSVASWLAGLTARYRLPQKLLVLHQFRLSMIGSERQLDTRHDDLSIVIHMDGQGAPALKQHTWEEVTRAAPPGVFFGWKNFYAKDHPMLSPGQTMARTPRPVMISYQ